MSSGFHLYRHFDADGTLLYVGQSNNCFERFREHRCSSRWTASSVMMRIEHFESREAVVAAERQAIALEKPLYNAQALPRKLRDSSPLMFYATADFLDILDTWRAAQRPIPNRSDAIRRLVEQALSPGKAKR